MGRSEQTATSGQMLAGVTPQAMGRDVARLEARAKVTGTAPYAVEHPTTDPLYAVLLGAPFAKGRVTALGTTAALATPGVHSVIDHTNAPRLTDPGAEMDLLQDDEVRYHGEIVAIVLGDSLAAARHGAQLITVEHTTEDFEAAFDHDEATRAPEEVNAGFPTDSADGDVDSALAGSGVRVDELYTTPHEHNNPMEPHASIATWRADGADGPDEGEGGDGVVLDMSVSTQHPDGVVAQLAPLLGLDEGQMRVRAPHVGGGFGSKGMPHPPDLAAAMAARTVPGRPVKLAVTRQQMFSLTGYRTATGSRVRLGSEPDGQLAAIEHAATSPSSRIVEYAEQTAVTARSLYGADARRTSHRLQDLDIAIPSWMRAPGVFPGTVGPEIAMDELAVALGLDPIELRRRNDVATDPDTGKPFSERRLMECFDHGARLFGWSGPQEPASRVDGDWRIGAGVATATYPGESSPTANQARITALGQGRYAVAIAATDIGTGAWTTLRMIAADALGVAPEDVDIEIGDSALPSASVAGGSSGTSSWGSAIVASARELRAAHGEQPAAGTEVIAEPPENPGMEEYAHHSFGAQFAEVGVHRWTGEVRARRLLGVFSAGRILNPRAARSQLIGGMVMGLGAALHEESVLDPRFGHVVTRDLASYHVPAHADVADIEAHWLEGEDLTINPMGARGIGEIGITGIAAAIANATYAATGIRVRELPLTPEHFV